MSEDGQSTYISDSLALDLARKGDAQALSSAQIEAMASEIRWRRSEMAKDSRRAQQIRRMRWTAENLLAKLEELERAERSINDEAERIRDELAEHYPIAITARALCNEEARIGDLYEIIDTTARATKEERIARLPPRLRGNHG